MNKIRPINFREIKRVSPSQFTSMKYCTYKALLAEAFDKKPLLPLSLNAYFGTVLHKMLELIAKGNLKSEDEFNKEFDNRVKRLEDELLQKGYDFYVPLEYKIKHYGLKKIQLEKHLLNHIERKIGPGNINYHSEKWFESKDKLIGGFIDLVIEKGMEIEIIDVKTGLITQDFTDDNGEIYSDVKIEYKDQLKLYAYLYFETTGKFPTSLSIVDLGKQKKSVEFSQQECKALFDEAKALLKSTNHCIITNAFSANPSVENCKNCLYRPICSFYRLKLEIDLSFNDVIGKIKDVKKFQNGNVSLFLQNPNGLLTIKKFNSDKFDLLDNLRNKVVSIYNLRKEDSEFVYSVTNTTMIYE
jgi:CRISPR/Cas system-associated exonuclease Cas4 (RecB family)